MEYDYKQIEKFIKGELPEAELIRFEEELNTNSDFKKEVMLYQDVDISLSDIFKYENEDKALQVTFNQLGKKYANEYSKNEAEITVENADVSTEIHKEEAVKQPTITRRLFPLAALAAAAALLLFLFNPLANQVSPAQLAEQNFTPYQLDALMGSGDNAEADWTKGAKYYRAKDYNNALQYFNVFLKNNPNNKEALLAKGSAQMKLNLIDEAIQTFQQINSKSKASEWYLALAYLKNDEAEKAKGLLQNLSGNTKYDKNAKTLLNDLR